MITIKYNPSEFSADIYFHYNEEDLITVKELGAVAIYEKSQRDLKEAGELWKLGGAFNQAQRKDKFKGWQLPLNDETAKKLNDIKEDGRFNIDPLIFDAIETVKEWEAENLRLSYLVQHSESPTLKVNDDFLFSHQLPAVQYIFRNSRACIVADDEEYNPAKEILAGMGQGIDANISFLPALIICNSDEDSHSWLTLLQSTAPLLKVKIIEGYKWEADNESASVYIIKYNLLHKYFNVLSSMIFWNCIIYDKTNLIYNKNNLAFKYSSELEATHKILISGTNIKEEAYKIAFELEIIGKVKDFGGFWYIINNYTKSYKHDLKGWVFRGSVNAGDLEVKLRKKCYIRRKKEQLTSREEAN